MVNISVLGLKQCGFISYSVSAQQTMVWHQGSLLCQTCSLGVLRARINPLLSKGVSTVASLHGVAEWTQSLLKFLMTPKAASPVSLW